MNVIGRYAQVSNLRTEFLRIIERAGFLPWERIFHNMRATRQTELEDKYPSHVVCAWMGNSERTARKHYLQVRDEHFERAAESGANIHPTDTVEANMMLVSPGKTLSSMNGADPKYPRQDYDNPIESNGLGQSEIDALQDAVQWTTPNDFLLPDTIAAFMQGDIE